ncbi:MAG: phosphatidylglycerophosphatase A [Thermodesulfobacteriota bacterium]
MTRSEKLIMFVATGFGAGTIPFAPGTLGSVVGVGCAFLVSGLSMGWALGILAGLIGVAVWVSDRAEKMLGKTDPGCIVIDEIAGMMVAMLGLPFTFWHAVAGFAAFRVFDIIKPFPIRRVETMFPGGAGIVADDLLAGVAANLVVRVLFLFFAA